MNKKICFYTPPFPRVQSQYDLIDIATEYGLPGVEGFCNFEFTLPDIEEAKKIRDYADKKNIEFPCFSVYIDIREDNLSSVFETLKGYANIAKILGSPYLHHTIVPECNPDIILPYREKRYKCGVAFVREIYDYAESIGVKAIYEPQGCIFNGIEAFGNFIEDVNRDIGIVADFGNIYQSGDNIVEFIKAFPDKICHVHLKDVLLNCDANDEKALKTLLGTSLKPIDFGAGNVDFDAAVKLLKSFGYDGYYSIEHRAMDDCSNVIDDTLEFIERLLD